MRLHYKTHTTKQKVGFSLFLTLAVCFLSFSSVKGQVTIGSGEKPESGALLDLKQITEVVDGEHDSYKGLMLPRVILSKKNELFPMFLADPEDPTSGANAEYTTSKTKLDKSHTGLIVYNLNENDDEELCLGLNQWDGEQWNCFESKMGNAQFEEVTCDNIVIWGRYVEGKPLDASNYITVNLNIVKEGAYTIKIETTNGYSFYGTGVALNKGPLAIELTGQGQPQTAQTDILTASGITLAAGCTPSIQVSSSLAEFSLSCSDIIVSGSYKKGTPLTTDNTIKVRVNVSKEGAYSIYTPVTNGIRFEASGEFSASQFGSQLVTLIGKGTPTIVEDFPIKITTSSPQGNAECSTTIPVTLPAMTYAVIETGTWSWAENARKEAFNGDSFGVNGLIRIESFNQLWQTTSQTTAANNLTNGYGADKKFPDVVLYFAYGTNPNAAITSALIQYINKGGSVIYGSSDNTATDVNIMMKGIFGIETAIAQTRSGSANVGDDDVYPIANDSTDPIINGPFGNLAGRHWGEDNGTTGSVIMTQLPPNSIQICSARSESKTDHDPSYSIVWYNESYNFCYFGDSVGASETDTSTSSYPAIYNNGLPRSKNYGPSESSGAFRKFVFNSALELNAVAWAMKKAAVSGINPY